MGIKMNQNLKLKQSQRMVMSPQMQQAIHFLSLTHLEMKSKITEAMTENPLLEEGEYFFDEGERDFRTKEAVSEHFELPTVVKKDDFDWDAYIESYNNTSSSPPGLASPPDENIYAQGQEGEASKGQTLAEHLEWQLGMEKLNGEDYRLAREIIHNLSEEGFLETPLDELLRTEQWDRNRTLNMRSLVQGLDPLGCGSDNWQECLLFQARMSGEDTPLLEKVVREYVGKRDGVDYQKVAKEWGVRSNEVKGVLQILKGFHLRPGLLISNQPVHYIVPDVYVVKLGEEFVVRVNDEGVPRLKISKTYRDIVLSADKDSRVAEYVRDKLTKAMWFIKSVQTRQKTLYRVACAIVSRQQDFFKKGSRALKPMILRDIADEISVHYSTVSRASSNKYMHTPAGLFELKYFFNKGVSEEGGGSVSSEAIRLKIKDWIEKENPHYPLSDQKIAELLAREDLTVARRTVAKYREKLGLPSAFRRRERN